MHQPLKAALVGCGSVSQRGILPHLNQADARERVLLEAIVDAVEERDAATAKGLNVPRYFTSVQAMLSSADVNLALVATPCRGSARIPWGGMGLYRTVGTLEVTEVDLASGYPTKCEVQGCLAPSSGRSGSP